MKFLINAFGIGLIFVSSYTNANGLMQIKNVASGKCLDVPDLRVDNRLKIQQYSCRGSTDKLINAQLWRFKSVNGYTQIENVASGKCLDVPDLRVDNRLKIQQYSCRGSTDELINAQLWRFKSVNGYTQIENVASGKCLDVPDLKKDNKIKIQQYSCRGSTDKLINAQLWMIKN